MTDLDESRERETLPPSAPEQPAEFSVELAFLTLASSLAEMRSNAEKQHELLQTNLASWQEQNRKSIHDIKSELTRMNANIDLIVHESRNNKQELELLRGELKLALGRIEALEISLRVGNG
jgi:hypothetical protein